MMSERRALLDPEMYKISEEDSQDEEVLSSLRSLSLRPSPFSLPPQPTSSAVTTTSHLLTSQQLTTTVKWPSESESDDNDSPIYTSSSSSQDQSEHESEDESSSSSSGRSSYSATTSTSCSSCESRKRNNTTDSKNTRRDESSQFSSKDYYYHLSRKDIEFQFDGNLRLIEFFSSSSEESDEEEELSGPSTTASAAATGSNYPSNSQNKIQNFNKKTTSFFQQEIKPEGGRLSRFLNQNSTKTRRKKKKKKKKPQIIHVTLKLNENENPERKFGLIENLLGIIPMNPTDNQGDEDMKDRIVIGGFCGDAPGANTRHLQFGDWIRTINGIVVNSTNVDFILSALEQRHPNAKREVKVSITRAFTNTAKALAPNSNELTRVTGSNSQLLSLKKSSYKIPDQNQNPISSRHRFYLLYVKPGANSKKSSIFQWPLPDQRTHEENLVMEKLESSIPTFEALFSILRDVGGESGPKIRVKLCDELMEIGYLNDDDEGERESFLLFAASSFGAFVTPNFVLLEDLLKNFERRNDNYGLSWPSSVPAIAHLTHEQNDVVESYIRALEDSNYAEYSSNANVPSLRGTAIFLFGKLLLPLRNGMRKSMALELHSWIGSELNRNSWPSFRKLLLYKRALEEAKAEGRSADSALALGFGGVVLAAFFRPSLKNLNNKRSIEPWILKFKDTVSSMALDPIILSIPTQRSSFSSELTPCVLKNEEGMPLPKQGKIQSAFSGIKNKIFKRPSTNVLEGVPSSKDSPFGSQSSLSSSSSLKDETTAYQNDENNSTIFTRSLQSKFLLHLSRVEGGTTDFLTLAETWDSCREVWDRIREGILLVDKELYSAAISMMPLDEFSVLVKVPTNPSTASHPIRFWVIGRRDSEGKSFACILDKDVSPQLLENVFALGKDGQGSKY